MREHSLTQTVSQSGIGEDDADEGDGAPRLVVALECRRPSRSGLRVSLAALDELTLGRGTVRAITRSGRRAELTLVDHELSRQHARLRRTASGWELVDLGSKNGTVVNADPITRTALADGDLIEVGGVLLFFLEGRGTEDSDRDLAAEPATPLAFRTVTLELQRRLADLAKVSPSSVPVLVRGETGTGKELIARAVHELSGRPGAFVAINCGALPRTLIESELFGYRRGAFSGARDDREGLVRRAHGGTLFLDEIAELPEESQVTLLRVLQEREVRPIGAAEVVPVDVRVIAATHQDLRARITEGRFRQDLYARLAGFEFPLPPLRERREDLGTMIAAIVTRLGAAGSQLTFHRKAARALLGYAYPLNARELALALGTACVLANGGEVRHEHLPEPMRSHVPASAITLRPEERALRERLIEILAEADGNVAAVGRAMGKAPIQIRRWCRRLGIELATFRR